MSRFSKVPLPKASLVPGTGTTSPDVGANWHLSLIGVAHSFCESWCVKPTLAFIKTRRPSMNHKKSTLVAVFSLMFLLAGRYTPAQTTEWSKKTAAAMEANQRGEYSLAQTLYKEAIQVERKTLGADNPEVAISLNNLAVFYQDRSM